MANRVISSQLINCEGMLDMTRFAMLHEPYECCICFTPRENMPLVWEKLFKNSFEDSHNINALEDQLRNVVNA